MIIDISGIELLPGNRGSDCLGNGEHFDEFGNKIECCCDECDYMLCCFGKQSKKCAIIAPILNVRGLKAKNGRGYRLTPHISLWGIFVL